jgi:hypothetical protein
MLGEEGIEIAEGGGRILYRDIATILAPDVEESPNRKSFPIAVVHQDGVLQIPKSLTIPSADLYRFLTSQLTLRPPNPVPAELKEYYDRLCGQFGAEKVFSFRGRKITGSLVRRRCRRAWGYCLLLFGFLWLIYGIWHAATGNDSGKEMMIGMGLWALIVGGILSLIALPKGADAPGRSVPNRRDATLIVSPVGVVLIQGKLRGEAKWSELRRIDSPSEAAKRRRGLTLTAKTPGIQLVFDGSELPIVDVYEQPLGVIHARLMQYWRRPQAAKEATSELRPS